MASTKMVRLMTTCEIASIVVSSIELADFLDGIALVEQHHLGLVPSHFTFGHRGVGADDQQVADVGLAGGRAVERDDTRSTRRLDDVGGEAFAVVDVVELDVLELLHVGGVQQVFIDPARALVVQIGLGHRGAVKLGSQHDALHGGTPTQIHQARSSCPSRHIRQALTMSSSRSTWNWPSLLKTSFKKSST